MIVTGKNAKTTKLMLLGAGELGREVAIEAKRLGLTVIAIDRYENAPAMQMADVSLVFSLSDSLALANAVEKYQPDYIVPEIEAIATEQLIELEKKGFNVIPTAKATHLTMNRQGIRELAADQLKLPSTNFQFAENLQQLEDAVNKLGMPCVVKPIMSSSGKGQSVIYDSSDIKSAWLFAQNETRGSAEKVIVESWLEFDYEITLLTIRHSGGTDFCQPIGHKQVNGDYLESWQPQVMSYDLLTKAQDIAYQITQALGGYGLFGVELFIKGDDVYFSEVSPRPHDTGLVTLISQQFSEFSLHVRAILGLPLPRFDIISPAASYAILAEGQGNQIEFSNLQKVLEDPDVDIKLFNKPDIKGKRRMGVLLARANNVELARQKNKMARDKLNIEIL